MNADRNRLARSPVAVEGAVYLWLLTVPVSLALGVLAVTLPVALVQAPPPIPTVAGVGAARALIVVLAVVSAAVQLVFATLPLAYVFTLRRGGPAGRRARTSLTILAVVGVAATVAGYLAAGTIDVSAAPFSTSKSVHDLLHDTLETLWTLAALSAIALALTGTARCHLRRSGGGAG